MLAELDPPSVERLTLVFVGEDSQVVQRFAVTSQQSGGDLAADVAVVLGLFMDGVLVFKGGRKR